MKMLVQSGNELREIKAFVNEKGISQERIVDIMQDRDGVWMLVYFGEE